MFDVFLGTPTKVATADQDPSTPVLQAKATPAQPPKDKANGTALKLNFTTGSSAADKSQEAPATTSAEGVGVGKDGSLATGAGINISGGVGASAGGAEGNVGGQKIVTTVDASDST